MMTPEQQMFLLEMAQASATGIDELEWMFPEVDWRAAEAERAPAKKPNDLQQKFDAIKQAKAAAANAQLQQYLSSGGTTITLPPATAGVYKVMISGGTSTMVTGLVEHSYNDSTSTGAGTYGGITRSTTPGLKPSKG